MKNVLCALALFALVVASTGCNRQMLRGGGGCVEGSCGGGRPTLFSGGGILGRGGDGGLGGRLAQHHAPQQFAPGPPAAQTAYPYYTTRGPRDYFCSNPSSIGPY